MTKKKKTQKNYQAVRRAIEKTKAGQCDYRWPCSYIRLGSDIQAGI